MFLLITAYATHYRQANSPIQALSLIKGNQELNIPKNQLRCTETGTCTVTLNGDALQIDVEFEPTNNPSGMAILFC